MANVAAKTNIVQLRWASRECSVFAAVSQVEAYWDGLCDGGYVPTRAAMDPRALQSALQFTFVLERIAPSLARFRIAGSHLTDLMGLEVRGMPLTSLFLPQARQQIGRAIENVCDDVCLVELSLAAEQSIGRRLLSAKMLLAPLCDENGNVTRILGCLQSKGSIGRQPRRFDIDAVQIRELDLELPDQGPCTLPRQVAARPADTIPAHKQKTKPSENRPALQLVIDNV